MGLIPKSEDVAAQLLLAFRAHPLFEMLEQQLVNQCTEAMVERHFERGAVVIKQGDAGDHFFIVFTGTLEAYSETTGAVLETFGINAGFGELALLYDSPRACSVRATTESVVYALDRAAFRKLVMSHNSGIKHGLERHLATVPMLNQLQEDQLSKLADVMEMLDMNDGEYIVHLSKKADSLFLILSGEVVCHREGGDKELVRLKQGDFFGESAIGPSSASKQRQANVVAVGA